MKKFGLFLALFAFVGFISLNSCTQKPKAEEATEEVAPAEEVIEEAVEEVTDTTEVEAVEETTEEEAPTEE